MALDGKILYRAKMSVAERKQKNESEQLRRTNNIYEEIPQIKNIDNQIQKTIADVISAMGNKTTDTEKAVLDIGLINTKLQNERRNLLVNAGYPSDYLDIKYTCSKCEDKGYVGTKMCNCLYDEYKRIQNSEITSLMHLTDESFDTFELNWYKDSYDEKLKINPRKHMKAVFDACKLYAVKFGEGRKNLFLTGASGLGKTFLSGCIAREVAQQGKYSVVYRTACEIFSDYETARFGQGEEQEKAKFEKRRYETCDLLILDDLGTEMTTALTVSSLYELINSRLIGNCKTVISTNLPSDVIASRYSSQIYSRIQGEYQILPFCGEDIRIQKKRS